ncbi:hypothetical protein TSOC_006857, partial [Tetrabaena socialis]
PSWQQLQGQQQLQPRQQQQQRAYSTDYQQAGSYGPSTTAPAHNVNQQTLEGIKRINPQRQTVNRVTLLGIVTEAAGFSERSSHATLLVPFSTKPGFQSFTLEAWDDLAGALQQMNGMKVLVEGRLSQDARSDSAGVKVVASSIQASG